MLQYRVLSPFKDKETKEVYQRNKYYASEDEKRVKDLQNRGFLRPGEGEPLKEQQSSTEDEKQTEDNKQPENTAEETYPKHTGGEWYELSNGEKVQGKEEAEKAEADL